MLRLCFSMMTSRKKYISHNYKILIKSNKNALFVDSTKQYMDSNKLLKLSMTKLSPSKNKIFLKKKEIIISILLSAQKNIIPYPIHG